jgi:DNA (cytosine-5)-methyltransferase 1
MNELHLFAGAGGGILGGILLGHTTVCAVEIEPYPRKVLLQRQRDGILPKFPIWDDVCTFDGIPWRDSIDVICGGFPCQDISSSGSGVGIKGERSGLWKEYARIISEIRPQFVFAENSPMLRHRGLNIVLQDLASLGYDARWCVLGSRHVGGATGRKRLWLLANANGFRGQGQRELHEPIRQKARSDRETEWFRSLLQGRTMPYVCREGHGMANGMDRLRAIGNGQDARVAALAWRTLSQ